MSPEQGGDPGTEPLIYVFTGPTLAAQEAQSILDAVYLPPVSQGDVYRATLDRPWAIAIIDGYFEHVPAVWHKEILWAMSEGIHVFGAASTGALRAAELEAFGMVGIGKIFQAYRDERLEDDDEVAIIHTTAEHGFRPASEAMVSIRATLDKAVASDVIVRAQADTLQQVAKSLYYPRRTYPAVLKLAVEAGMPEADRDRLEEWLEVGRVDQKREDAVELLRTLAELSRDRPAPKRVRYTFQRTDIWENAVQQIGRNPVRAGKRIELSESLLDELRLLGRDVYRQCRDGALTRALAVAEAKRQQLNVSPDERRVKLGAMMRRHGLHDREQLSQWLAEVRLDEAALHELLGDQARIDQVRRMFARDADRQLPSELRARGMLARMAERVQDKHALLGDQGIDAAGPQPLDESELLNWYFEERLACTSPPDPAAYAADLDLPGTDVLLQILAREYCYVALAERVAAAASESRASEQPNAARQADSIMAEG